MKLKVTWENGKTEKIELDDDERNAWEKFVFNGEWINKWFSVRKEDHFEGWNFQKAIKIEIFK
jgi:hypothetical protein